MSQFPCLFCDAPIPESEAERANLCPVCSRPLSVCGRFQLKGLLSRSEADRVYAAVRDGDGQEVAVKVWLIREDDWSAQSEFERVSRTVQGLKSRSVPLIHAWERAAQGRLILVRERLQGGSLAERTRYDARRVLMDLLEVLSTLHKQSPPIVHRDLRRENVLFRSASDPAPVLVDFSPVGEGGVAEDLAALGRMIDHPIAHKLAQGQLASADDALRELRQSAASVERYQPPPPPQKGRRVWPWVVLGAFILLGQLGRLFNHHTTPKQVTTTTTTSDTVDATVEKYRRQCDSGDALGCYNLGYRYEKGKGIRKDESRAAALYGKSCDMGEKMACNNLAVLFESGRGVAKDPRHAADLYQRACDKKDWLACRNLGYLYSNGVGVAADVPRALGLYQRSCDHDEQKGCYNLAVLYENGKGVAQDLSRARDLYQQACDGKDWEACTNLAWMYAQGKGVAVDGAAAQRLYQKACDHGDARGCNNLGVIFEKGRGVAVDYGRALELYRQACDGDDWFGCSNLGYFYEVGRGVDKDPIRATGLYQKSCKLGYDKGCQYFLDMLKNDRTRTTALALLSRACDDGDGWSCDQLKAAK